MSSKHYLNGEKMDDILNLSVLGKNMLQITKQLQRHHVTIKIILNSLFQNGKRIKIMVHRKLSMKD